LMCNLCDADFYNEETAVIILTTHLATVKQTENKNDSFVFRLEGMFVYSEDTYTQFVQKANLIKDVVVQRINIDDKTKSTFLVFCNTVHALFQIGELYGHLTTKESLVF